MVATLGMRESRSNLKVTALERVECVDGSFAVDWVLTWQIAYNLYHWQALNSNLKKVPLDEDLMTETLEIDWDRARIDAARAADSLIQEYRRALWQRRSRMDLFQSLLKAYQSMAVSGKANFQRLQTELMQANAIKYRGRIAGGERALAAIEAIRDFCAAGLLVGATALSGGTAAALLAAGGGLSGYGKYQDSRNIEVALLTGFGSVLGGAAGGRLAGGAKMALTALSEITVGVAQYKEEVAKGLPVSSNGIAAFAVAAAAATISSTIGKVIGTVAGKDTAEKVTLFVVSTGFEAGGDVLRGLGQGKAPSDYLPSIGGKFVGKAAEQMLSMPAAAKGIRNMAYGVGLSKNLSGQPSESFGGKNAHDVFGDIVVGEAARGVGKAATAALSKSPSSSMPAQETRWGAAEAVPIVGDSDVFQAIVSKAIKPLPRR